MNGVQFTNCAAQKEFSMKRVQHEKSPTWKRQNAKGVQYGNAVTWTKFKDRTKFLGKKSKRTVHYKAETDNQPTVNGSLCTGGYIH